MGKILSVVTLSTTTTTTRLVLAKKKKALVSCSDTDNDKLFYTLFSALTLAPHFISEAMASLCPNQAAHRIAFIPYCEKHT